MAKSTYLELLKAGQHDQLASLIDQMSHADRIELRESLEKSGCKQLARNLFYDYEKQMWIEA